MRGTIIDDGGVPHRVSRIWASDDAGAQHEVVKAWVGDSQGVPRLWFDKDAVLKVTVTPTVLDALKVRLNWVLGPQGEVADEYQVYRDGVLVYVTTQTTFTDSGLTPSTTYTWRVDVIQKGAMTVSGSATATTSNYIPPAVATLTATAGGYTSINLTWTVSGQDSFAVRRGSTVLATTGTSYTESGLLPSTSYNYTITATRAGTPNTVVAATGTTTTAPVPTVTATNAGWDRTTVGWTNAAAASYEVYRNDAVLVYRGPYTSSITDTGLNPGTGYFYTVYPIWGGNYYPAGRSGTATTSNRAGMGFRAIGQQGQIYFDWNDPNGGGVDAYEVWLYSPSVGIIGRYAGPGAGSGYHTGLPDNWTGYYELTAFRGSQAIHKEQAGARTYRLATGSVAGDATASYTGWTGATRRDLTGRGFAFPVSGTMTLVNGVFYGHVVNGRVAAMIGGVERDHAIVGPTRQANNIGVSVGYAAGTHSVGIRCGGSSPAPIGSWGQTEWSPPANVRWDYNVCIHRVDYVYYTSAKAYEELRLHEWWDRDLEDDERDFQLDTWDDGDGTITRARITDKETGDVLVDWEREG